MLVLPCLACVHNGACLVQDCVKRGELSALQLETIVYANQRFHGPFLPDGERQLLPPRRACTMLLAHDRLADVSEGCACQLCLTAMMCMC